MQAVKIVDKTVRFLKLSLSCHVFLIQNQSKYSVQKAKYKFCKRKMFNKNDVIDCAFSSV